MIIKQLAAKQQIRPNYRGPPELRCEAFTTGLVARKETSGGTYNNKKVQKINLFIMGALRIQ
jgi:hypothetical protein